jgi:hypothetical protein
VATTVTVGGNPATEVVVVSPTQLTAVVPAGAAAGPVDVTVTGTSGSDTLTDGYTYLEPPVATRVAPSSGAADRTAVVTLFGTGFSGDPGILVYFGGAAGTTRPDNGGVSTTAINVTPPPGTAGQTVDVYVDDPVTGDSNVLVGEYTYLAAGDVPLTPTLGVVDPTSVPADTTTIVTVTGTGFISGETTVWVRVLAAEPQQALHTVASVASATELSFSVPANTFQPGTSASLSVYTSGGAVGRGNAVSFT